MEQLQGGNKSLLVDEEEDDDAEGGEEGEDDGGTDGGTDDGTDGGAEGDAGVCNGTEDNALFLLVNFVPSGDM